MPLSPDATSIGARRSFQANRGRDTRPELALRSACHQLGLRYRVDQAPIRGVRRRADLVFRRARVAVFLDGCFWHGCPEHYSVPQANADFWADKLARNRARDRETDQLLQDAGWLVLRFWEHDDRALAAEQVRQAVRQRLADRDRPREVGVVQ